MTDRRFREVVRDDPAAVAHEAATLIAGMVADALEQRGEAVIALAGGATPREAYRLLARLAVDWSGVTILPGDERCVPEGDGEANITMIGMELLGRIPDGTASPTVIAPPLGEAASDCAEAWERDLSEALRSPGDGRPPILDVAVLGIGEDGHTASLFPGAEALDATGMTVAVEDAPKPPPQRVSLTLPMLAASRQLLVLATGASKFDAVRRIRAGRNRGTPASLLPEGKTLLLLDRAAAGG